MAIYIDADCGASFCGTANLHARMGFSKVDGVVTCRHREGGRCWQHRVDGDVARVRLAHISSCIGACHRERFHALADCGNVAAIE